MHYQRWYRYGDPAATKIDRQHASTCSVDGCVRPYVAKGLCAMHWQRAHAGKPVGDPEPLHRTYDEGSSCIINYCPSRPRWSGLCSFHAERRRRGLPLDAPPMKAPAGTGYVRPDGYIVDRMPGHPLANASGEVLRHRAVLFGTIGPGEHPCHWCDQPVEWTSLGLIAGALVVDHVDWDTTNNDPANLVPSCHPCNSGRLR